MNETLGNTSCYLIRMNALIIRHVVSNVSHLICYTHTHNCTARVHVSLNGQIICPTMH